VPVGGVLPEVNTRPRWMSGTALYGTSPAAGERVAGAA
jgi:hypothetical protein